MSITFHPERPPSVSQLTGSRAVPQFQVFPCHQSPDSWIPGEPVRAASITAERPPKNRKGKRGRVSLAEYNERALKALKNPRCRTARKLKKAIGCGLGTVSRLPAWRAYQEKLNATKKRTRSAVSLTSGVLANEGRSDPELNRLIAEHAADFEESPLVPKTPRKPRRRRQSL
jgi:hypothetical protein